MWNKGNVDVCDEVFAENCSFHDPSFEINAVAGMNEQVRQLRAAQPDLHADTHEIHIDGDLPAARLPGCNGPKIRRGGRRCQACRRQGEVTPEQAREYVALVDAVLFTLKRSGPPDLGPVPVG